MQQLSTTDFDPQASPGAAQVIEQHRNVGVAPPTTWLAPASFKLVTLFLLRINLFKATGFLFMINNFGELQYYFLNLIVWTTNV